MVGIDWIIEVDQLLMVKKWRNKSSQKELHEGSCSDDYVDGVINVAVVLKRVSKETDN